MFKDSFPNLFALSFDQTNKIWSTEFDFKQETLNSILTHYEDELLAVRDNASKLQDKAKAIVTDILALKEKHPQEIIQLDFLQFAVSTSMLTYFTQRRVTGYCFDWICNSLSDYLTVDGVCNYGPYRIHEFLISTDEFIKENLFDSLRPWVYGLFYYSSYTGGHKDLANTFIELYLKRYLTRVIAQPNEIGVHSIDQIIAWSRTHKMVDILKKCSKVLYIIYRHTQNEGVIKNIAFHFAITDFNGTGTSKSEWCKLVKKDYYDDLNVQQQLQLLLNLYDRDCGTLLVHFEEILSSIRKFNINKTKFDDLDAYYHSRVYSTLYSAIFILLQNGHVSKANLLIGTYFGIPEEELIQPTNFYIIPNDADSVIYVFENSLIYQPRVLEAITELVKIENSFLGITHQLNDYLSFEPDLPARSMGEPNPVKGNEYYQALSKHFNLPKLFEKPGIEHTSGYHLINGTQWPIQPMMTKELGLTFPLIHSFYRPKRQRKIKKVFIWEGETNFAEYERKGLEEIFNNSDVKTKTCISKDSAKEDFITAYHSQEYDIIWVISHGQFAHHESHKSYLDLGNNIHVSASELNYKEEGGQRRLLIIDACDGATINMNNNADALGIGPGLIKADQSLISHCWPVRDLAALIYGLLLASFLVDDSLYQDAYGKSVKQFLKGQENILDHLREYITDQEVLDRIINGNIEFDNFYYWGSIVYME